MTPLKFTRSVRSLNRLRQIAQVLTQQGFGHIVAQMHLSRFVPVWMLRRVKQKGTVSDKPSSIGRRIADVCAELGPTFVKFGQMITTRPDIVPTAILEELRSLQDDVPPFDGAMALRIIAEELGAPISEHFEYVEEEPIACGSISQVHRARTIDGKEVVIKVRRPEIDDTIATDMQLLHWLAESIESLMPELNVYRPRMLVAELEEVLTRELDFVNEASATDRLACAFAEDEGVSIPKVFWDLSGKRILTLKAIPGQNIETIFAGSDDNAKAIDKPLLASRIADCFLKQVFEIGMFHADPHPGNILVSSPADFALIDFGQVGTITDELMTQMVVMVYAAVNKEIDVVVDSLADLGALGPDTDRRQLSRSLQAMLDKYHGLPMKRIDIGVLVNEFADVVRLHDVIIPRDAVLLFKATGMIASTTAMLDPNLNLLEPLTARLKSVIGKRLSPTRLTREAAVWGWHLFSVARSAPRQLREVLRQLAKGGWKLKLQHENIDRLVSELDRSSNRLAFSIVIAAIIVGSSVVVSADTSIKFFDIDVQYFGIIGFLMAGILGLGLSWAIFRSGRLH